MDEKTSATAFDAGTDLVASLLAEADELAASVHSPATRRAYASDWADFEEFCAMVGHQALPATHSTVAAYLALLRGERGLGRSTIHRRAAAIGYHHSESGHDSPTDHRLVRRVLKGIRRTDSKRPVTAKALSTEQITAMVSGLDGDSLRDVRDRALILVGFAAGLRRSELCAIDLADVAEHRSGLVITITRGKTDQEATGRAVAVPFGSNPVTCPVRAIQAWITRAALADGPLFRRVRRGDIVGEEPLSAQSVNLAVKQRAQAAGLPDADRISAHSLRAGFASTAAANGATERAIANQTGHRSSAVLRGYIQRSTVFEDNAVNSLGL